MKEDKPYVPVDADKLMSTRCRLLSKSPFYGSICLSIEWIPSNSTKTMGARILSGGKIQILYNKEYTESRPLQKLYGEIQHVLEHLIRLHPVRGRGLEKELWGIATDQACYG